jgi:hypothetical protein
MFNGSRNLCEPTPNEEITFTMKLSEGIRAIFDEGGAVLLHPETGKYLSVNRTGASLCQALRSDQPQEALVELLRATYHIDAETAKRDVTQFIASLGVRGLLDEYQRD